MEFFDDWTDADFNYVDNVVHDKNVSSEFRQQKLASNQLAQANADAVHHFDREKYLMGRYASALKHTTLGDPALTLKEKAIVSKELFAYERARRQAFDLFTNNVIDKLRGANAA